MSPGGIFSSGKWEKDRSRLHHDYFHHRFYHFLAASEDVLISFLMTANELLPSPIEKAFRAWPAIAIEIRSLIDSAQVEAIADPVTMLARLALESLAGLDGSARPTMSFPADLADEVRLKANAVIVASMETNRSRIEQALVEPRELLEQLNRMVATLSAPRQPMSKWDAMAEAQRFLDVCRRFDRALSGIPASLRGDDSIN